MRLVSFPGHPAWDWSHFQVIINGLVSFLGHPAWGWSHPQTILCVYTYMVTLHHQYRSLDWVCPVCGVANRNLLPRCKWTRECNGLIQIMSCNAIKYTLYNVCSQLDTRVALIMVSSCSVEENSSQEDMTTEAADIVAQMAFKVQWNLRIKDTLGAELLSSFRRLSFGGRFEPICNL